MMRPPSFQEQTLLSRATRLHQAGDVAQARLVYREVLALRPEDADLLRLLGTAEFQLGDYAGADGLLAKSLAIAPNQPSALYNRGLALQALNRMQEAIACYDAALELRPDYADAHINRGNALLAVERFEEALASYDRALAIRPEIAPTYANRALALAGLGKLEAAAACHRKALALNPAFVEAHAGLAAIYERQGDNERAVVQWSRLAEQFDGVAEPGRTHRLTALNNMARILADNLRDDARAEIIARESLRLDPSQDEAAQDFINARQRQCEWPIVAPFDQVTQMDILRGLSPLSACAFTDDPMLQLAVNWRRSPPANASAAAVHRPSASLDGPRLKVGYLSSDLREHPIGHLMYEIPGLHDRRRVEAFAYYCGPEASDPVHQHYRAAFEHFVDLGDLGHGAAAQRIADDGIQILVDINGHTAHNRKPALARRPAPVIVNWLGFPGSMGSAQHHYILADDWTIPPQNELYFSEKVLRLPCYQPNNRARVVSKTAPTRSQAGLPKDAFVFCCFNDAKKISRHTFDRWLEILQRTPQGVLWLLSAGEATERNLRRYAQDKGVSPDRLIFAPWIPNPEHLARYPLADLFIDTAPYGAHTTCSDALWMGVPVVTLSGRSFASRVCGSLLRQAGLDELVCARPAEFVDAAVSLAQDPDTLRGYRDRLRRERDASVLFDTPALVRRLEELYAEMWRECLRGALPVPDLTNMEAYLAVGLQHDHEAVEVQSIDDYEAFWRERLALWARSRPVQQDDRFCRP